ncbi:hypothetical protein AQUCO_03500162v1 [Aquilegia coerulea]|uniref:Uncharacterized protein n=1 Tax=Aquilegia coerulea TaxID=218851 RepID=A0A2G5CWK3_AQUCA|nr:hypothetical protein AQUCO_03500162v1 [Aquilegia coerulea]
MHEDAFSIESDQSSVMLKCIPNVSTEVSGEIKNVLIIIHLPTMIAYQVKVTQALKVAYNFNRKYLKNSKHSHVASNMCLRRISNCKLS